jgi:FixJ family two-component response regulator/DNA-binding MarR family transcriptional regulator
VVDFKKIGNELSYSAVEQSSSEGAWVTSCSVLVIDDDRQCLEEYCEVLESLAYTYRSAYDAREALEILAEDQSIGIVITDFQMAGMDGAMLLEEIAARYGGSRPLVTLMITGYGSLETAINVMRQSAVDFLEKPVSRENLISAVRRAAARRSQMLGRKQIDALQAAATEKMIANDLSGALVDKSQPATGPGSKDQNNTDFVRNMMASRRRRFEFLDPDLFSDPAWDILLELTLAKLEGVSIPTSSACAATSAPYSTAFRHIGQLVESGLVRKWKDPKDSRLAMLELEDDAYEAMIKYVKAIQQ